MMIYEVYDGDEKKCELLNIYEAVGYARAYVGAGYSESPKMKICLVLFDSAEVEHGAQVNMDEKISHLKSLEQKLEHLKPRFKAGAGTDAEEQSGSE